MAWNVFHAMEVNEVERRSYLRDVDDEEWEFVLPYLLLSREDSRSRQHSSGIRQAGQNADETTGAHVPDSSILEGAPCAASAASSAQEHVADGAVARARREQASPQGKAALIFEDGSREEGDLVIAADGAGSALRE
jgi:hypothetical protein